MELMARFLLALENVSLVDPGSAVDTHRLASELHDFWRPCLPKRGCHQHSFPNKDDRNLNSLAILGASVRLISI
jgi:hypothetical protein